MKGTANGNGQPAPPGWRKAWVLAALTLAAALAASTAPAQEPPQEIVADVIISGNQLNPSDRILRSLKTQSGRPFSREALHDDIAKLYESRTFRYVRHREERTADGRVTIYLNVTEYPNTIHEIVWKNAHHLKDDKLEEISGLRKGSALDPTVNRNACFKIQDHLKQQGRYFANVTLEEGDRIGDRRVVVNITEGPVVRVRSIQFKGNKELANAARLRTQIDGKPAVLQMIGGVFNPALVDHDVIKLQEYYRENGYLDARVQRELSFSNDFMFVDIVFFVHEGQKYRVESVGLDGPQYVERNKVASIVKLKQGDYYTEATVNTDLQNIKNMYGWQGYMVNAQKELYYPESGLVRVQYQVEERPQAKVGQVIIVGNRITQDRVIRRMVGLYPGQTLRYPELRLAERNLARLNIFKMDPELGIRPTVSVLDTDSEYKDILVTIEETTTGSFMVGAGINSNAGLVGSIVLNERNFDLFRFPTSLSDIFEGRAFRGAGQEFRIEAVPGTELQRYTVSFREPFLFDMPYSLSVSGFYYDRVFNEYTERRTGGRINISNQVTRQWSVTGGVRIEEVNVRNVPFYAPQDYLDVQGPNFLVGPRIAATFDTRDSYLRPTEGSLVDLSYEQIFGDYTFPIVNIEGSRYFTTYQRADGSGKHVLSYRGQASWAGSDVPVFERFFAGGFRSIRGFEFRGVGPFTNGFAVGGDFMVLNSLEYQVPIRANDQLHVVAFVDSGTVERNFEIKDYRVTAGFGLRITMPAVLGPAPIALDFGFPIVKGPQDQEQLFSFWIGMFR